MAGLCLVFEWWSETELIKAYLWSKMSGIPMVCQVTWLPFEYRTPILSKFRWLSYSDLGPKSSDECSNPKLAETYSFICNFQFVHSYQNVYSGQNWNPNRPLCFQTSEFKWWSEYRSVNQMVIWILSFHVTGYLNNEPFNYQTEVCDLNTKLVHYSDPQGIIIFFLIATVLCSIVFLVSKEKQDY